MVKIQEGGGFVMIELKEVSQVSFLGKSLIHCTIISFMNVALAPMWSTKASY